MTDAPEGSLRDHDVLSRRGVSQSGHRSSKEHHLAPAPVQRTSAKQVLGLGASQ